MEQRASNYTSVKCRAFLVAMICALALPGVAGASVNVWFSTAGKPTAVVRSGNTIEGAVHQLLAGPTAAERAHGLRTAIPRQTPLRSIGVARRVVTVDLGARFAAGSAGIVLQDRVSQLVRTVRGIPGVVSVRVLVEGGVPVGLFPGYDLRRPVAAAVDRAEAPPTTRALQQRLVDLGFMAQDGITGTVDDQTSTAVLGFQKWANLTRDGSLGAATVAALLRATRPVPALRAPGRRIEMQLRRQVALLIEDNRVVRAVHVSSGAGGKTPRGSFHVYRKERYSWSVPFSVWLPWASYFVGGVAFHEFGSVPTYAASHGCIRVNHYDAPMLFGFAEFGTRVDVIDEAALA
jgi:L,D-transpeptidase catalytic domain/Sporulation and spore germination/Putative peptidoglycan binding domain